VSLETFDFAAKKVERAGDKKSNVRSTLSDGLCRQSVCVPGIIADSKPSKAGRRDANCALGLSIGFYEYFIYLHESLPRLCCCCY